MKGFVLDASVLVELVTNENATPVGRRTDDLIVTETAIGPPLLWSEPRNAVLKKARTRELTTDQRDTALDILDRLPILLDEGVDRRASLRLALAHGLSVHDAFYLEIAIRYDAPLATNDRALRRAATAEGVALV